VSAYAGFPPDTWAFLTEPQADNSKAFFDANRQRYDDGIAGPSKTLVKPSPSRSPIASASMSGPNPGGPVADPSQPRHPLRGRQDAVQDPPRLPALGRRRATPGAARVHHADHPTSSSSAVAGRRPRVTQSTPSGPRSTTRSEATPSGRPSTRSSLVAARARLDARVTGAAGRSIG
jgi:hypothetical protein